MYGTSGESKDVKLRIYVIYAFLNIYVRIFKVVAVENYSLKQKARHWHSFSLFAQNIRINNYCTFSFLFISVAIVWISLKLRANKLVKFLCTVMVRRTKEIAFSIVSSFCLSFWYIRCANYAFLQFKKMYADSYS